MDDVFQTKRLSKKKFFGKKSFSNPWKEILWQHISFQHMTVFAMERGKTCPLRKHGIPSTMKHLMVTGGCGFIGSNFINHIGTQYPDVCIYNVDRMDYCSKKENVILTNKYKLFECDVNNKEFILHILRDNEIDTIVHFAAQSHVDNSFGNSLPFTRDNVMGTHSLLEACRIYGGIKRFIHISTDEVYGEIELSEKGCTEMSLLNPTNPYAASKAAAEFIVRSYYYSYQIPIIVVRGNNVFGPRQYPEKIIAKFIECLWKNQKCPIQGHGDAVRNFIFVDDFVQGVETILKKGEIFHIYNIGTRNEYTVMDIARLLVDRMKPGQDVQDWVTFVEDRLFNDKRYCIDNSHLLGLGWQESVSFDDAIDRTIAWFTKENERM